MRNELERGKPLGMGFLNIKLINPPFSLINQSMFAFLALAYACSSVASCYFNTNQRSFFGGHVSLGSAYTRYRTMNSG